MRDFILYSTSACHLCELAEDILWPLMEQQGRFMQKVDIASDDALLETYGVRIPVLCHPDSGVELGWPFDRSQAQSFVARCSKAGG